MYEDENWLKDESYIKGHFEDNGNQYFDYGQGYYQEEADVICKIGEKFYSVSLYATYGSSKQDYGDRLFYIEDIKVEYEEIEKPLEKKKNYISYNLILTNQQQYALENFMKQCNIQIYKEVISNDYVY